MVDLINTIDFLPHHDNQTPQNIQAIKLFATDKSFILEPNTRTTQLSTRLVIERYSKLIKQERNPPYPYLYLYR